MKKISLVLLIAAFAMVFTACSKTPETKTPNNTPNSGQSEQQPSADPVTLKIVYKDEGKANPASVKFFEELEKGLLEDEKLQVKFELVDVAQGSYSET